MAYNKARAEKEWLKWKNEEESKLRELGVDEDTIQRLHAYDWSVFKSDRRFYEPQVDLGEWLYSFPAEDTVLPIYTVHRSAGGHRRPAAAPDPHCHRPQNAGGCLSENLRLHDPGDRAKAGAFPQRR